MTESKIPPHSRPIMRLLDLLSRRWALRVIWELRDGPRTSRSLREAIKVSPTVLQARANELRTAGIITLSDGAGYEMTELGRELSASLAPLHVFARRWAEVVPGNGVDVSETDQQPSD